MTHDRPVHVREHISDALEQMGLSTKQQQQLARITNRQAPQPQTPEELCWCFAAGCLQSRHQAGTIDEALYTRLNAHMLAGTYPTPQDVRAAFPRPFGDTDNMDGMRAYWRNHNTGENTPVFLAIVSCVCTKNSQHWAKVFQLAHGSRWELGWRHNHLRAPLKPGSRVWVHGKVVTNVDLTR